MSNETLPLPINVDASNLRISASMVGVNKGATGDTKDMFFFGDYVSSGTKYAALYRNTVNSRLTFAITSTKPSTTVAGTTAKSMQVAAAYCAQVNCAAATASRAAYVDGTSAILASKIPFAASYGQAYRPKAALTYGSTNTYITFGNTLVAGTLTSDWSITAASPGIGLKYTGPPAYVEVYYFASYQCSGTKYSTVAVGSGTPVPGVAVTTRTITSTTCAEFATYAAGRARAVFAINTNDSVIPYTASATAGTYTIYTLHLLARVLGYV